MSQFDLTDEPGDGARVRSLHVRLAFASFAMLASSTAPATTPPPPPPHARYGPLTQCLNGYAFTASATEAVFAMRDGVTLVSETGGLNLSIDRGDPYRKQAERTELAVPHLGQIARYHRTYTSSPPDTFYLLPGVEGEPTTMVSSREFNGTDTDLAILGRISRVDEQRACGDFRSPDFPGENPDARWWKPTVSAGPLYRCQNGVGFAVLMGESVQSSWPMFGSEPAARLRSGNTQLIVRGPIESSAASLQGFVAATYRQAVVDWSGRPVLLLSPSDLAPDRYGHYENSTRWVRIEFSADAESEARALASRLEFVEATDPRCRAN